MKVLFIAPFPPPVTGHSLAARVFHDDLVRTHQVAAIDLSFGSSHDGALSVRRVVEVGRVIGRVLRERRGADVVYLTISESVAGNLKDLLIYLVLAGRLGRVYVHLHGGGIKKLLFDRHPVLRWLNKSAIRRLGGVILTGQAHQQIFTGMIDERRVHVVPNFAQDDMFVSPDVIVRKFGEPRPLRVLYASGMTEPKGYLDLVDAYLRLGAAEQGLIRLDFAGRFATAEEHERFVDLTGGLGGIRYHGVVDGEVKRRLFAEAHVFCLPTKMLEGQPISILEAYASGCVVVTTGQDGIRDVFADGRNGVEVPVDSPADLATALAELAGRGPGLLPIALENRRLAERRYRTSIFNRALGAIVAPTA
jgi:glycosyltransferase involved in cell wall biosynthesis